WLLVAGCWLLVASAGSGCRPLARREEKPATSSQQPATVTHVRITYIGHATLLLELGGATILTDPNFDPKLGRILPRVSPPGIAIENLPALDAILLTHEHADHLSFDSLERLPKKIPLLAPPVVAKWLRRLGHTHAVDLAPDENTSVSGVNI